MLLRIALFFVDLPFLPARLIAKARHRDGAMRASTRWLTAAVLLRLQARRAQGLRPPAAWSHLPPLEPAELLGRLEET